MPKKKPLEKPPIPLGIKPHDGERSPHILNLRRPYFSDKNSNGQTPSPKIPLSFEERVAAFDERVKDVPDFLRHHADHFSKLAREQRQTWQDSVSSFFQKADDLGNELRHKLSTTAEFTKKTIARRRSPRLARAVLAHLTWPRPPQWARQSELGLLLCVIILLTIPLQGLLIYRAIQTTKSSLQTQAQDLRLHGNEFFAALQVRDLPRAKEELRASLLDIKKLRKTAQRFGPLRVLLPERLRAEYDILEIAEVAALSSEHILGKALDLQKGSDTLGALLEHTATETALFTKRLQTLAQNPRWNLTITPLYERLRQLQDGLEILAHFSGAAEEKNILLVFQNPRELRATGGFLGSFALLVTRDGQLRAVEVPAGGSYAGQGQLTLRRVSPQPLHLLNPRFELQDANWWPDFPTSARKIAELYEAGGGTTLDGVIAVTAQVGERILEKTGPLKTPQQTFTANTFIDALQDNISADRALNRRAPKKIIAELFPLLTQEVQTLATRDPRTVLDIFNDALIKKDLQIWSKDEKIQAALARLNLSGTLRQTSGDYLAVITANVGGGKTDGAVTQEIRHRAYITAGAVRETVTITRAHQGKKGNERTGHQNISYIRVYVPAKARLISAQGFTAPASYRFESSDSSLEPDPDVRLEEFSKKTDPQSGLNIWSEQGKTVFGHWLSVKPGESAVGEITYEIPFSTATGPLTYTLTFDPQAGTRSQLNSEIQYDPSFNLVNGTGAGIWRPSGWNFEGILEKTLVASGVLYRL